MNIKKLTRRELWVLGMTWESIMCSYTLSGSGLNAIFGSPKMPALAVLGFEQLRTLSQNQRL